jgi:hypothetical protein
VKMQNTVLVGADPELFMKHPDTGMFISADTFGGPSIPGTKWDPYKVPFGAVQIDGTALEFNITPAHNVEEFVHNIIKVRETICSMVPGYNVVAEPVARFDPTYWAEEVPPHAQELGCNPDYNGWTKTVNPPPDPQGAPLRTASGHIHIGWGEDFDVEDNGHFLRCCQFARQLDFYLGMYSLFWDKDGTRRNLYGKAGAFRPKSYGLEYRVLSNRWLDNPELIRWVYNTVQVAMADGFAGMWAEDKYGDIAQVVIDTNDIDWPEHYAECDLNLDSLPLKSLKVA